MSGEKHAGSGASAKQTVDVPILGLLQTGNGEGRDFTNDTTIEKAPKVG